MTERIGIVLYLMGCAAAAVFLVGCIFIGTGGVVTGEWGLLEGIGNGLVGVVMALLCYLVAYTLRYILSGRTSLPWQRMP